MENQRSRLLALARSILRDEEEARDVVQEAFLEYLRRRQPPGESSLSAWLIRVVTNRSLDRLRRRRNLANDEFLTNAASPQMAPAEHSERRDVEARIRQALMELPRRQRSVVFMRLVDHTSFSEIASQLGISVGAAKVHFRRGLELVRRRLADYSGDQQ